MISQSCNHHQSVDYTFDLSLITNSNAFFNSPAKSYLPGLPASENSKYIETLSRKAGEPMKVKLFARKSKAIFSNVNVF